MLKSWVSYKYCLINLNMMHNSKLSVTCGVTAVKAKSAHLIFRFYYRSKLAQFIIVLLNLISLPNHNEDDPKRKKRASSIQYGFRKCGTHARMFPLFPNICGCEHQERNNTKKQKKNASRRVNMEKKQSGHERKKSQRTSYIGPANSSPGVDTPPNSGLDS